MHKILIIDDDFAVQTSLSLLLNQNDYETVAASNPDEALDAINEQKLDLIILDMNFTMETTGEEGLALLKEIKNLLPTIPVILITAWGSISLGQSTLELDAQVCSIGCVVSQTEPPKTHPMLELGQFTAELSEWQTKFHAPYPSFANKSATSISSR